MIILFFLGLMSFADDCTNELMDVQIENARLDAAFQKARKNYMACSDSGLWCNRQTGCWCDGLRNKMTAASIAAENYAIKTYPRKEACCSRFNQNDNDGLMTEIVKTCGSLENFESKNSCYDLAEACHSWSRGNKETMPKVLECRQLKGFEKERCLANYFGEQQRREIANRPNVDPSEATK